MFGRVLDNFQQRFFFFCWTLGRDKCRERIQQSEKGKVFMGRKIQLVYEIGEQVLYPTMETKYKTTATNNYSMIRCSLVLWVLRRFYVHRINTWYEVHRNFSACWCTGLPKNKQDGFRLNSVLDGWVNTSMFSLKRHFRKILVGKWSGGIASYYQSWQ